MGRPDGDAPDWTPGYVRASQAKRVGRNQPCPCGSGRKAKHCHGRAVTNP
jgi:preprotein translocase subunit SecA